MESHPSHRPAISLFPCHSGLSVPEQHRLPDFVIVKEPPENLGRLGTLLT